MRPEDASASSASVMPSIGAPDRLLRPQPAPPCAGEDPLPLTAVIVQHAPGKAMEFQRTFVIRIARSGRDAPPAPVARAAADRVQDFRPAALRYRRHLRRSMQCAAAGAVAVVAAAFVPHVWLPWVAGAAIALLVAAIALFLTLPALTCPACTRTADGGLDCYCPACGSEQLKIHRLWGTHCNGCGRRFGHARLRDYPIRFCTHCGVVLDQSGV